MTCMIRKVALFTGSSGEFTTGGREIDYDVNCLKELNDDEYATYQEAREELITFEKDRNLWAVVCLNCIDFELFLDHMFDSWVRKDPSFDANKASLEIDRRVLNFVSSYGAYIEHLKYRYPRRYKRDSVRTTRLLEILSDKYFPYQFVLKYRNHVLHCGQPISHFGLNTRMVEETGTKMEFHMSVTLNKTDLVEDNRNKKKELEEMKDWPEESDIRIVLRDAIEWAQKLNQEELQKDIREVEESALYIKGLSSCWEGQVGTPCIFEYDFDELKRLGRMPPNTLEEIPMRCAEMVLKLKREVEPPTEKPDA